MQGILVSVAVGALVVIRVRKCAEFCQHRSRVLNSIRYGCRRLGDQDYYIGTVYWISNWTYKTLQTTANALSSVHPGHRRKVTRQL